MRAGLVLIELLFVVVLTGLLALFAVPRLLGVVDAVVVRDETMRVVAALDAARGASVRLGTVATLTFSDTSYRVSAIVGIDTLTPWRQPGPGRNGVLLSGGGQPVLFGPAGLALGVSNRTIIVTKGQAVRKIVVSKLGRTSY
jgi:Tfp pilus assembly protein FimT